MAKRGECVFTGLRQCDELLAPDFLKSDVALGGRCGLVPHQRRGERSRSDVNARDAVLERPPGSGQPLWCQSGNCIVLAGLLVWAVSLAVYATEVAVVNHIRKPG